MTFWGPLQPLQFGDSVNVSPVLKDVSYSESGKKKKKVQNRKNLGNRTVVQFIHLSEAGHKGAELVSVYTKKKS